MLALAAEFDRSPPETTRALLYCRQERRPRMHGYTGKVPILARPRSSLRRDEVRVDRVDHVFECEACGACRVWGNTPAFPHAPPPVRRADGAAVAEGKNGCEGSDDDRMRRPKGYRLEARAS